MNASDLTDRASVEAALVSLCPGMKVPAFPRNVPEIVAEVRHRAPTFDLSRRLAALAFTVFDARDDGLKWIWCGDALARIAADVAIAGRSS